MTLLNWIHNLLRWFIIIYLFINIFSLINKKVIIKNSLFLMIFAHIQLLVGLCEYFFNQQVGAPTLVSNMGGMLPVMNDPYARFWVVEHIAIMLIAIILITIGHISLKKKNTIKKTCILYVISLIIILIATPWPFRQGIGRPWLPFH